MYKRVPSLLRVLNACFLMGLTLYVINQQDAPIQAKLEDDRSTAHQPIGWESLKFSPQLFKPPSERLRIALCVSGALRSFANDRQRHNFVESFYIPFDASTTIHTFLCLDDNDEVKNERVMRAVNDSLRPVDLNIVSITCDDSWCKNQNCIRSGYEQFRRFDLCMDRIIKREKEDDLRYDFIIRTRPDIVMHESLPRTNCWLNLRRDVVWDGDVQFFGGEPTQFFFGNALREGTNTFVDRAQNADSVSAFLNVIPREIGETFMRGIAGAYQKCIPEIGHTASNLAIRGEDVLKKIYGESFAGGCGKGNARWRWDECRLLIQTQLMNVSLGRVQARRHTALARCRHGDVDAPCADVFVQLTGEPLKNVTTRDSCFPVAGYNRSR